MYSRSLNCGEKEMPESSKYSPITNMIIASLVKSLKFPSCGSGLQLVGAQLVPELRPPKMG